MATPFDGWLRELEAAGKGPVTLRATRGRKLVFTLRMVGNWTDSVLRGEVRDKLDSGEPLAQFTISAPVVATIDTVEKSTFTISLPAGNGTNSTGSLPADARKAGFIELPFDILAIRPGKDEELLIGGSLRVMGRVTI